MIDTSQTLIETQPEVEQEDSQTQFDFQQPSDLRQEKEGSPPIEWPPSPQDTTSVDVAVDGGAN